MKESSIKKMINEKIDTWISTIDDIYIQNTARENIIVTGGCIASMLTGDDVNDYDIYFKNRESAIVISKYYVSRFNKNTTKTNDVDVLLYEDNSFEHNRIAALSSHDRVILNAKSTGVAKAETEKEYDPIFISDNAITLSNDIQLIVRFFGDVDEIHSNFDFIHATCSFIPSTNKLTLPPKALMSLLSGDLYYSGSKYPVCSLFRLRKFISRGWKITGGQILKIALQVSDLNLNDVDVLRDQLVGVDTLYFLSIIDIINKKKDDANFIIDNSYLSGVIDKVFE